MIIIKVIFHIDLNAFFASAELVRHPEYKGKPLVVSNNSKRSVITTASYEARRFGVHSAMPLFKAQELCKKLIIVAPDMEYYRDLSNRFFEIITSYSNLLEIASIDECYVDVTDILNDYKDILFLAKDIQMAVYKAIRIDCSIGISYNKFLAKMASDMEKPKGITIITKSNFKTILWSLSIDKMLGIGKKTAPKLKDLNIFTIGDLAKYSNYDKIKSVLGKNAIVFYYKAHGVDISKMKIEQGRLKSISSSTTLLNNTNDENQLKDLIKQLVLKVSKRAKSKELLSKNISINFKNTKFESIVRSVTIDKYTDEYEIILSNALILLEKYYDGKPIRLIGVSLNQTINKKDLKEQLSLFDYQDNNKEDFTNLLLKDLNQKIGNNLLKKASDIIVNDNKNKKY